MPNSDPTIIAHNPDQPVAMTSNTVAASQQAEYLVNQAIDELLEKLYSRFGLPIGRPNLVADLVADPLLRRAYKIQNEAYPTGEIEIDLDE